MVLMWLREREGALSWASSYPGHESPPCVLIGLMRRLPCEGFSDASSYAPKPLPIYERTKRLEEKYVINDKLGCMMRAKQFDLHIV